VYNYVEEGLETKFNNYVDFVDILKKEFEFLMDHFYAKDSERLLRVP
jgi:hypothetical protein